MHIIDLKKGCSLRSRDYAKTDCWVLVTGIFVFPNYICVISKIINLMLRRRTWTVLVCANQNCRTILDRASNDYVNESDGNSDEWQLKEEHDNTESFLRVWWKQQTTPKTTKNSTRKRTRTEQQAIPEISTCTGGEYRNFGIQIKRICTYSLTLIQLSYRDVRDTCVENIH